MEPALASAAAGEATIITDKGMGTGTGIMDMVITPTMCWSLLL